MTIITPNMSLVLPDIPITIGPVWAALLNSAYSVIDSHNHSSGQGVAITPSGLNISSDLTFAQNNATNLRSLRLFNNTSFTSVATDKTCLYSLNNELYYIDGAGNVIQITSGGILNVSVSLTSLTLKDSTFTLQYFGDLTKQLRFDGSLLTTATQNVFSVPNIGSSGTNADVLVSAAATQTLTNKTLGSTNNLTGSRIASFTPNGTNTITVPTITDTLVTLTAGQTLTNKVLTGNIIASFTPDGTHTISVPATATDTLVTLAASQTLTNKTLTSPIITAPAISNFANFTSVVTPATPSAGTSDIYINSTDGQLHLLNSAGVDTAIGSSTSSGKNYLQNYYGFTLNPVTNAVPSLTLTGNRTTNTQYWGCANATVANVITYNTSGPLRAPGDLKITFPVSDANEFVESPLFTLDLADVNTNQQYISFDMNSSTAGVATGDLIILVKMYNSSGVYQSIISPSITALPLGFYKFKCAFPPNTTTTNQYSIYIQNTTTSARVIEIQNIIVGPQQIIDGTAIGQLIPFTPSTAGFGTVTNASGYYRRVGDSLEIQASWTNGTVAASIASLQLPNSLLLSSNISINNTNGNPGPQVGYYTSAGLAGAEGAVVTATGSTTNLIYFGGIDTTTTILTPGNGSAVSATGAVFSLKCTVPISTYSAVVTLAQSPQIEYAFNTSNQTTAGATDSTSFGYGASGTTFNAINSSTITGNSYTTFIVQFQNPILPTDRIQIEINTGSLANGWIPLSNYTYALNTTQGGASYGIAMFQQSNNKVGVQFGNAGQTPVGTTYASTGSTWSVGSTRWRVGKYSGVGLSELAPSTITSVGTISRENIWTSYTPTISAAAFGVVTGVSAYYKVLGDSLFIRCAFTAGTVAGGLASITIPTQFTISSSKLPLNNTTSTTGCVLGDYIGVGTTAANGYLVSATGTSTSLIYFGPNGTGYSNGTPVVGTTILTNNSLLTLYCEVPIV